MTFARFAITKIVLTFVFVLSTTMLGLLGFVEQSSAQSSEGIVTLTNIERKNSELPALSYSSKLSSSAAAKAEHMCTYNYWAHTAPDGTKGWDFVTKTTYRYISLGENLASNYTTDSSVVTAWMDSPSHRDNILSSKFNDIGVGVKYCSTSTMDWTIVVAHYGQPKVAPTQTATSEEVKVNGRVSGIFDQKQREFLISGITVDLTRWVSGW